MDASIQVEKPKTDELETPPPALELRRVLVVDDDRAVRDSVAQVLRDEGYAVETVANGAEAMASLTRTRPNLVLLDLMMPLMDGHELLEALKEAPPLESIPVVVMTAAENAHGISGMPVFIKPVSIESLLRAVRAYAS